MEVVRIGGYGIVFGDEGVVGVGGRGHFRHFAKQLGFFHCLLGPGACVEVGSLVLQEVVGYHTELQAGAAAEEEDAVAVRYLEQLLEEGARFVHDGLEVLGAVADLHQ